VDEMKKIRIIGARGVPATHGGFEVIAEQLSLYLVSKGWQVTVYCQEEGSDPSWRDEWRGVERIHIPVKQRGPFGTMVFDWLAIRDVVRYRDLCFTCGYNTAMFCARIRMHGIKNVISMDGIDWLRSKWGVAAKTWLWLNERAACWLGNHLIADHPEIKKHLSTRIRSEKITTIVNGAEPIGQVSEDALVQWGLKPRGYFTLIARPEPENSVLEIVQGFSKKRRGMKLFVLGNYHRRDAFQRKVLDAASDEVIFAGAVYDKQIVRSLRSFCTAYFHGHQVGGTNPSLIEAMAAGNAVIAHGNRFNRWVLGESASYFLDVKSLSDVLEELLSKPDELETMRTKNYQRYMDEFTWVHILKQYEELLTPFSENMIQR
jgi:glycosyltransferase involved in cell wall biosynthesis